MSRRGQVADESRDIAGIHECSGGERLVADVQESSGALDQTGVGRLQFSLQDEGKAVVDRDGRVDPWVLQARRDSSYLGGCGSHLRDFAAPRTRHPEVHQGGAQVTARVVFPIDLHRLVELVGPRRDPGEGGRGLGEHGERSGAIKTRAIRQ